MQRSAGILLPIFALNGGYGIGGFDKAAYQWIDFLVKAKQSYWQILPLGPTSFGDSPYQSFSTFAGNPYHISLDELVALGYLSTHDLPAKQPITPIDYANLYQTRFAILRKAFVNSHIEQDPDFLEFIEKQSSWLDDYALFMALKDQFNGLSWNLWDNELRLREPNALLKARKQHHQDIRFYQFLQYQFQQQWNKLKTYANNKGIKIIGDIPIYVAYDSADVWANPKLFQFNQTLDPIAVAGCPPDGFSADGQLWGNPLYQWDYHQQTGYQWWIERIKWCYQVYDVVRIDHFRGFDEYYAIPFGEKTAHNGQWLQGPGFKLFQAIQNALGNKEIIAEDLGFLTESVVQLLAQTGYPGMKILQFAFDSRDSSGANNYLPHNFTPNCIAYTGTHDNETTMGWFDSIPSEDMAALCRYLCTSIETPKEELLEKCICLMLSSVANLCIIPMQDYLHLDNNARINTPSTLGGNWDWRMSNDQLSSPLAQHIAQLTQTYGRANL